MSYLHVPHRKFARSKYPHRSFYYPLASQFAKVVPYTLLQVTTTSYSMCLPVLVMYFGLFYGVQISYTGYRCASTTHTHTRKFSAAILIKPVERLAFDNSTHTNIIPLCIHEMNMQNIAHPFCFFLLYCHFPNWRF